MHPIHPSTCPSCRTGRLLPGNVCGRTAPFRDLPAVAVDEDLVLPVCSGCGEIELGGRWGQAFYAAVSRAYHRRRAAENGLRGAA